jgi:hypothetical protein
MTTLERTAYPRMGKRLSSELQAQFGLSATDSAFINASNRP